MGTSTKSFEQWLCRPRTCALLRQLLAVTEPPLRATISGRHAYAVRHAHVRTTEAPSPLARRPGSGLDRNRNAHTNSTRQPAMPGRRVMSWIAGQSTADWLESIERDDGLDRARESRPGTSGLSEAEKHPAFHTGSWESIFDEPHLRQDMQSWIAVLYMRERLHGLHGARDVWSLMQRHRIHLPTAGAEADLLWTAFLHVCIVPNRTRLHEAFLGSIINYAADLYRQSGSRWRSLYTCIVGRCLRLEPSLAIAWHLRLVEQFEFEQIDTRSLVVDCICSVDPSSARHSFRAVQEHFPESKVYQTFLTEMLRRQSSERVMLFWHRYCLSRNDLPTAEMFADTQVQRLLHLSPSKSSATNDVNDTEPRGYSDAFVSKWIATKAFSLDIVLGGLSFLGVDKLGPRALLALALRTSTCMEYHERLTELREKGISIRPSAFASVLTHLASHNLQDLFDTLLASDQHPDALQDIPLQERLLRSYLEQDDWVSVHLSLTIFSSLGAEPCSRAWNTVFQHYIRAQNRAQVHKIARQMQTAGIALTKRSLAFVNRHVLTMRQRGKRPITMTAGDLMQPTEALDFATKMYIHAAQAGTHVHPGLWVEAIKRYVMMHDWDNLERLVLWLVHWYGTLDVPTSLGTEESRDVSEETQDEDTTDALEPKGAAMLTAIFKTATLEAIVVCGFRAQQQRAPLQFSLQPPRDGRSLVSTATLTASVEPWARGLALLRQLPAAPGFPYTDFAAPRVSWREKRLPTIAKLARKFFLTRMWMLFGPAYSARPLARLEQARKDKRPLAAYVKQANEIFDGKLFDIDDAILRDDPAAHAQLLRKLFGPQKAIGKHRRVIANVDEIARRIENGAGLLPNSLIMVGGARFKAGALHRRTSSLKSWPRSRAST